MGRKAVFLDRDGTIIREAEYLSDPAGVELLPGAAEGIRRLQAAGFFIIVTSNQSGVARGFFREEDVQAVNARMQELLRARDAGVDAVYYCPHWQDGVVAGYARECECRKPKPGMLYRAVREHGVDLAASWVVGDKQTDIDFGREAGVRSILVLTGYGMKTRAQWPQAGGMPEHVAQDLYEAAELIVVLRNDPRSREREDG
ncbi:HAD family hydrolase [candidate division FCPU426 bacterium]|nr:HAD family hydrolase [candidate division FCPU426 bacterium]